MSDKQFDIDAKDNARVNAIGELRADTVNFGDRYTGQQTISVFGLDAIPPRYDRATWIDRAEPQAELLRRIEAQEKAIEIIAEGGFGKSLLAAWLFHQVKGKFDLSLWLNFRKLPTFNQFARWVLQEIGYRIDNPQVTDEALIQELMNRLVKQRCLLILDQLEELQTAKDRPSFVAFLQTWQQRGYTSAIVVASRSSWLEATEDRLAIAGFSDLEGVAFLGQKSIQAPSERLLIDLVQMAEGHPLLLNLAASWLRQEAGGTIDPAGLGFFQQLFKDRENITGKVEEIFAKLFAELDDRLQSLLLGVVVYRDPSGLEMAQAMGADNTIEDLKLLTERAFLLATTEERWTLHPLMANLVRQESRARARDRSAHQQAIDYFTTKIKPEKNSIDDCREEIEICHHFCELGEYALAYKVMHTCVDFLYRQGYYRDLLPIYDRLTQDWERANPDDIEERRNLGWAWTQLGNLDYSVGQYQAAISAHIQAQAKFDRINFYQGKASSLGNLGSSYYSLGEYQRAIEFYQQFLAIEQQIGYRWGQANALMGLGNAHNSLGEYRQAIEFYGQSLEIERQIGDRSGEAVSLRRLSNAHNSLGEYRQAIEFYQQSLDIYRQIGDVRGEANSCFNLGLVLAKLRRKQEAIESYQQARRLYQNMGLDAKVEDCDNQIRSLRQRRIPWWLAIGCAIVLSIAILLRR